MLKLFCYCVGFAVFYQVQGLNKDSEIPNLYYRSADLKDDPMHQTPIGDPTYEEIPFYKYFEGIRKRAVNWLLSQRKEDFGWGHETPRAITALHLSDTHYSDIEKKLMSEHLHLQLALAIARNESKMIPLGELALYINALQSTCSNPRNFHGFDLVDTLRQRVNYAHNSGLFAMPFVYLTLCLNDAITFNDSRKLGDMFTKKSSYMNKLDFQAVALLASVCMVKVPENKQGLHTFNVLKNKLLYSLENDGKLGNVYEAALAVQALNEARVVWNRSEAVDFILKQETENNSFGDILATYYILPILSRKSLLSLNDNCNNFGFRGMNALEVLKNKWKSVNVSYSLHFGQPVELIQTIELQVAQGTTFIDVMRLAEEINPIYRFRLDKGSFPSVYSIGGIPNDAEKGIFWTLYTVKKNRNRTVGTHLPPAPYKGHIKELVPSDGDNLIFWLKPLQW